MRRPIVCAMALGSCLWSAAAFAQDSATAATPAADGPSVAPASSSAAAAPSRAPDATALAAGDDAIHLHMPVHHRAAHAAPKPAGNAAPAETSTIDAIGADTTASPAAKPPVPATLESPSAPGAEAAAPTKAAKVTHKSEQKTAPAIPFSFGEDSGAPPAPSPQTDSAPQAGAASETKTASLPPKPELRKGTPALAKPSRPASRITSDEHAGLTKRGAVLFAKGVSNPSPSQFQGVKLLAGDVSTALEAGAGRVQLEAYSGTPGDKSSDARRLSLKRALAVRQLLIDNGVPSNRIDVRAMGGADDNGPDDRVDVFLRAS